MRQRWLLIVAMSLLVTTSLIIPQSQTPQLQATVQEEGPAPSPPQDGMARCINDGRRPDKTYPDKAHTNCPCWGRPDKQRPECKPKGEDPKCTNHCKFHMCDCDTHCPT